MRVWLYHARRDHRSILRGKVLSMVSPAVEGHTEAGIQFGSTSGHMYSNMPRIIKGSYVVPDEAFALEDYDAEYYVIMRLGIAADVTFLCTANPSSIVKMCEIAEEQADDLLRDLADGTLRKNLEMPEPIRAAVAARLKANPAKAKQLEAARGRRRGRLLPVDYWPRLALIGCWKGGTVKTYLDRFPDFFAADDRPAVPVRDWGYLSSEARGSVPLSDEGSGGVLTVASNVYEFVDVEDVDCHPKRRDRWRFLGVGDVKDGNEYYIFITTSGGLYRYDINDVIRVEGRYLQTPVIAFRRKGRGVTSITGEKVSENQVIEVVQSAAKALGVTVEHFKAEADVEAARYVFKVEVGNDFAEAQGRKLLEQVEHKLAELNIEYAGKRKSLRLKPPVLHLMKAGWHDTKTKSEVEEGKRIFQSKAAVLEAKDKTADDTKGQEPADANDKKAGGDTKSNKPDDAKAERDEMVVAVIELDDKP